MIDTIRGTLETVRPLCEGLYLESTQLLCLFLLIKVSLILAVAWTVQAMLRDRNPAWRRLLWRVAATSIILTVGVTMLPPMFSWKLLPPVPVAMSEDDSRRASADGRPEDGNEERGDEWSSSVEPHNRQVNGNSRFTESPGNQLHSGDRSRLPLDPGAGNDELTNNGSANVAASNVNRPDPKASAASAPGRSSPGQNPGAGEIVSAVDPANSGLANGSAPAGPAALLTRIGAIAMIFWLAGIFFFAIRTAIGWMVLRRIRGAAQPVPVSIQRLNDRISGDLQLDVLPEVFQTDQVDSPCLSGLVQPLILLPSHVLLQSNSGTVDLSSILAHECAHLQRHDLRWNLLWQALAVLFWFHPLVRRARIAHVDACDCVVDVIASRYVNDSDLYCRTLATLALRVGSVPVTVLGMARKSVVRRRIEQLKKGVASISLPGARLIGAVVPAIALAILLGGFTISRMVAAPVAVETSVQQEQEKAEAGNQDQPRLPRSTLPFVFTDEEGNPLDGVEVDASFRIGNDGSRQNLTTDGSGRCELKWNGNPRIRNVRFTANKPGYVAEHFSWSSDAVGMQLPDVAEFQMEKGLTIHGIVRDDDGNPIAGAVVEFVLDSEHMDAYVYRAAESTTDETGKWNWGEAPEKLTRLSVEVRHPEFREGRATVVSREVEIVTVLEKGISLTGRVTDADGMPVNGASVLVGMTRYEAVQLVGRTDEDGRYKVDRCEMESSAITIQHPEFAPAYRMIKIRQENDPFDFVLNPGQELKIRVVDENGEPIRGAFVAPEEWDGLRTLRARKDSDKNGNYVWKNAPAEAISYSVGKRGYIAARDVVVVASGEVVEVVLKRVVQISANVLDVETGEPVMNFQARNGSRRRGRGDIYWGYNGMVDFRDGKCKFAFDEPADEYFVQVTAEGYETMTSRAVRAEEGSVDLEFKLKRGSGLSGIVRGPDGTPLAGVEIGLVTPITRLMVKNGYFDEDRNNAKVVTSNDAGEFVFPAGSENDPLGNSNNYLMVALADQGFAIVKGDEKTVTNDIALEEWSQVKGVVKLRGAPDPAEEISFQSTTTHEMTRGFSVWWDNVTMSGAAGEFEFNRIIPGDGHAARVVITKFGSSQQHSPCWHTPVTVEPGGTAGITIGGSGATVLGRATVDRQPEFEIDWTLNEPAEVIRVNPDKGSNLSGTGFFRACANMDESGRFEIPDIPPGQYRLTVKLQTPPSPNSCGAGETIGSFQYKFDVNEGQEKVEIDEAKVILNDTLDPGEFAPDFSGSNLFDESESIRLRDYHGKVVLLDFWATWCKPCVASLREMEKVYEKYVDDPRFELMSVSIDNDFTNPAEFLKGTTYSWNMVYVAGGRRSQMADDYSITMLPTTFLIGPDGTILGKNLEGDDLAAAIESALADEKSFADAGPPPPRFPVTRYEPVTGEGREQGESPAAVVVVVAAAAETGDEAAHRSVMRMLTQSGATLWSTPVSYWSGVSSGGNIAIDQTRNRIYLHGPGNTTAFDLSGQRLWSIQCAGVLQVDPVTGNLWVSSGRTLDSGETVVFDPDGTELNSIQVRGVAMEYDSHSDSMWLVGYEIIKINRDFEIVHRESVNGWCSSGVAIDPADGTAWISERDHPDVAGSKSQICKLANDGTLLESFELEHDPSSVVRDPESGGIWAGGWNGVSRLNPDGRIQSFFAGECNRVSIGKSGIWIVSDEATRQIDREGNVIAEFKHRLDGDNEGELPPDVRSRFGIFVLD